MRWRQDRLPAASTQKWLQWVPFGCKRAFGAGKKQEFGKEGRRTAEKLSKPFGTCGGAASLLEFGF